MKLWTHKYHLSPKSSLNCASNVSEKEGSLLKVEFDDGSTGYSDLFPWVELGDESLSDQLWSLKTGAYLELARQSLSLAKMDADARLKGEELLSSKSLIRNHYLITNILQYDLVDLISIQEKGFSTIKIKMGRELLRETMLLEEIVETFQSAFKLRLDFNCSLSIEELEAWLPSMTKELKSSIEFIEDPTPYIDGFWAALSEIYGISFALDHAADPLSCGAVGADIVVIKPAKQNASKIIKNLIQTDKKFVVTHYMDHPVGRAGAVVVAESLRAVVGDRLLDCGLNDYGYYEGGHSFYETPAESAEIKFPEGGLGIGFGKKFCDIKWDPWT